MAIARPDFAAQLSGATRQRTQSLACIGRLQ